jgi:multidrug efflux pump
MGGIVGRLFREFSVTLSVAVVLSLLISLTTTPMMCARLLRPHVPEKSNRLARASGWVYDRLLRGYGASLAWSLRHPLLVMLVLAGTIALNFYLYSVVPKGFFPQQDTGRLIGSVRADQGTSFQAMRQKVADAVALVKTDPAVENVVAFTGGAQRNRAFMFVTLKPLEVRKISADGSSRGCARRRRTRPASGLFLNQAADVRVGGRQTDATYQFTLQADELDALQRWLPRLERALRDVPQVADVNTDQEARGLQTTLTFDRETAARLGLTQRQIDSALNLAFGQAIVSTIYSELNQYRVVMEVAPQHWQSPEALSSVWLISPKGQVPLSSIARWELTNTPLSVNHQGQFVAATLSFNLPPGVSLSQATDAVRDTMARIGMPASIGGTFQGTARAFQASLDSQPWLILAALVAVYLVLGILYESLVHPITILSTLPSAGVGALLALMLFGKDFDIIALIGVILLIGIVKKNAIMMIDVALDTERRLGKPPGGSDLRSVPAALPADHDDDAGGAARRAAARSRLRLRRRAAPAARHLDHGRPDPFAAADALYDAGGLPLPRPFRLWCLRLRGRRPVAAAAPTP